MKKIVLISLLVVAIGLMIFVGCEEPDPIIPNEEQQQHHRREDSLINQQGDTTINDCTEYWDTFPMIIPDGNVTIYLDSLFSCGNVGITYEVIGLDTVYSYATDTIVAVIHNNSDFERIGGSLDIDFSRYCIVYGRIMPIHSNVEISFDIRQCPITSEVECVVQKREMPDTWTYVFPKYFWGMYDSHLLERLDTIPVMIESTN